MRDGSHSKYNEDTKYLVKFRFGQIKYCKFLPGLFLDTSKLCKPQIK